MTKKILIDSCSDCPRMKHKGGFAAVSWVPYCSTKRKELPWTPVTFGKNGISAHYDGTIPDWCPLEDN